MLNISSSGRSLLGLASAKIDRLGHGSSVVSHGEQSPNRRGCNLDPHAAVDQRDRSFVT